MAHSIHNRFVSDVTKAVQKNINVEDQGKLEEAVRGLIEDHVDVDDPELRRIYNMSGRVMDAERREPITVTLDNPTKADVLSTLGPAVMSIGSAATGAQDWVTAGFVLLSVYSAVSQGRVTPVEPDVAMTYAVGWDLSNAGEETVEKDELVAEVIEKSKEHHEKKEMDKKDIESAIWKLSQIECISGDNILKFREKCTVEYK